MAGHIRSNVDAASYREKRKDSLGRYAQKKAHRGVAIDIFIEKLL